jgi:hypothetical protein
MLTSSVLILLVLPAMYLIVHRYAERRATQAVGSQEAEEA